MRAPLRDAGRAAGRNDSTGPAHRRAKYLRPAPRTQEKGPARRGLLDAGLQAGYIRRGEPAGIWRVSTQRLIRFASPIRVNLPHESSSTMITGLEEMRACITRQRPASLI